MAKRLTHTGLGLLRLDAGENNVEHDHAPSSDAPATADLDGEGEVSRAYRSG